MHARRFLVAIFIVTLVFVIGAFAIYWWGSRLLISQAVPRGHFSIAAAGTGADYRRADSWLSRPDIANDPSSWTPPGVSGTKPGDAAVFFVHPTTYLSADRWNAPLQPAGETEFRSTLFVKSQASAFNAAGQIWAPRYRQAAFGSFLLKSSDAEKALDFAFRDVAAAFDEFLKEAGTRPLILAGHSQGALQLERLLRERVAGKPLARRIVAAYVVGWPISTTADLPSLGLNACSKAAESACIMSWMTFGDPPNPDFILHGWEQTRGFNGKDRRQRDVLCTNPITGSVNGSAPPQSNPGTLVPSADLRSATLQPAIVGAHCQNGLLIVDGAVPQLGPYVLFGNNYHVYDYALFWAAVRDDAMRRLAAWHP